MGIQESQLSKEINEFESDSEWFYKNVDLLRRKRLVGKFVAIKNKEVIASGDNISIVIKMVEGKGENPAYVVIEYVYPEGTIILL